MGCGINLLFRCFGYGTVRITGLSGYYIGFLDPKAPPGNAKSRAHDLAYMGWRAGYTTISPCTFIMDHNAIVCFMTEGLTRGPDKDVHVPSVGGQKYPSYNVDVLYL